MASYPWSVLGLEGISSEAEIRKAYAGLLKTVRPDSDAAGFQRLVEARNRALAIAEAISKRDQSTRDGVGMPSQVQASRPAFIKDKPSALRSGEKEKARTTQPEKMLAPAVEGRDPEAAAAKKPPPVEIAIRNQASKAEEIEETKQAVEIALKESGQKKNEDKKPEPAIEIAIRNRELKAEEIKKSQQAVEIALKKSGQEENEDKKPEPAIKIVLERKAGKGSRQIRAKPLEEPEPMPPAAFLEYLQKLLGSPKSSKDAGAARRVLAALEAFPRQQRLELEAGVIRAIVEALRPATFLDVPLPRRWSRRNRTREELIFGLDDEYGWLTSDRRVYQILTPPEAKDFIRSLLALREATGNMYLPHRVRIEKVQAAEAAQKQNVVAGLRALGLLFILALFLLAQLTRNTRVAPANSNGPVFAPNGGPTLPDFCRTNPATCFCRTNPATCGLPVPPEQTAFSPEFCRANPMWCGPTRYPGR